jgi:hypothetical protein
MVRVLMVWMRWLRAARSDLRRFMVMVLGLGFDAEEVEDFWILGEVVVEFGEGEGFELVDGGGGDAGAGGDVPDGDAAGWRCEAGGLILGEEGEAGVDAISGVFC